jgi:hypothetical protein
VLIPLGRTAAEPHWSPGPGWVECGTASKWDRRMLDGRLETIGRGTDRHSDNALLIRGDLPAAELLGFGGIRDRPSPPASAASAGC